MAYVASTLGTYSTGTVTVVNGSTAVTGSGTVWGDIVNEGDLFTIDDDKFYYVAALNSDTSLTLDKPYAESSASGITYRVMLNTAAHFPSDVAAKVERALSGMGDVYCPIDHASSGSDYGLASASLYGHAKASGTTPKAPGTASVGTETNKFARGDHVHPHDDTKLDKTGGAFNKMFFSQISGSYIAPYTGVYRITLKGGGGGGGPTLTTGTNGGAGGGEGGTNIFYATLTKDVSYSYVIGAGGLGGVSAADINDLAPSTSGGDTSITIGNVTYTAKGGNRGYGGTTAANAPRGGVNVSTTGIYIPGCAGSSGAKNGSFGIAPGGGQGGGVEGYNGTKGGGGCGATPTIAATNGGDGYILIEYAG